MAASCRWGRKATQLLERGWESEWIVLAASAARLPLTNEAEDRLIRPSDIADIVAHLRHRVEWTGPATPTVWLAIA